MQLVLNNAAGKGEASRIEGGKGGGRVGSKEEVVLTTFIKMKMN